MNFNVSRKLFIFYYILIVMVVFFVCLEEFF
jgi:hypothetical protein